MEDTNESFRYLTLKSTRQPIRYQYDVKEGSQGLIQHAKIDHCSRATTTGSVHRDFFGTCFNCGCRAHSQNFCPLKECIVCKKWGHTDRVCYHRTQSNPDQSCPSEYSSNIDIVQNSGSLCNTVTI